MLKRNLEFPLYNLLAIKKLMPSQAVISAVSQVEQDTGF